MIKTVYNATLNQIEEHEIDESTGITRGIDLSGDTVYYDVVDGEIIYEEEEEHELLWTPSKTVKEKFEEHITPGEDL